MVTDSFCVGTEMPEDLELKCEDDGQFLSKQTLTLDQLHLRSQRLTEQKKLSTQVVIFAVFIVLSFFSHLSCTSRRDRKMRWSQGITAGGSQARSLPHFLGTTEMPLGHLPSDLNIFCSSKQAGTLAETRDLQMMLRAACHVTLHYVIIIY